MKKSDLIEKTKRKLGYPVLKLELDDMQISDNVDFARSMFIKWAVGQATVETYFTVMLSAGETEYEMPSGTTEVLGYETRSAGSIHTLFTMENYLYNMGMYDQLLMRGASTGYTMVSYHIARDFLETIKRYVVDAYRATYHRHTNILEVDPVPPTGGSLTVDGITYDSPGFILIRAFMAEGEAADLYESVWMQEYVLALTKISLGRIRTKFANFTAVGSNTGLSLDGDTLLNEGHAEKEALEEKLKSEETWEGWEILIG